MDQDNPEAGITVVDDHATGEEALVGYAGRANILDDQPSIRVKVKACPRLTTDRSVPQSMGEIPHEAPVSWLTSTYHVCLEAVHQLQSDAHEDEDQEHRPTNRRCRRTRSGVVKESEALIESAWACSCLRSTTGAELLAEGLNSREGVHRSVAVTIDQLEDEPIVVSLTHLGEIRTAPSGP